MYPFLTDLLERRNSIESIYMIGSHDTERWRGDSDIDVVVIVSAYLEAPFVRGIAQKYPNLDLTILDRGRIPYEIGTTSSHYLSAINQILLDPRRIFGSDAIERVTLSAENVQLNQLRFPERIFRKLRPDGVVTEIQDTPFWYRFQHDGVDYYSYRTLATLMLVLCSFKLIQHEMLRFDRAGKHWFMEEYLARCAHDQHHSFMATYAAFADRMGSNVFTAPSDYFESPDFKSNIVGLMNDYRRYVAERDQVAK